MSLTAQMAGFRRSKRHSAQAQNFPLEHSEHTPPIFRCARKASFQEVDANLQYILVNRQGLKGTYGP